MDTQRQVHAVRKLRHNDAKEEEDGPRSGCWQRVGHRSLTHILTHSAQALETQLRATAGMVSLVGQLQLVHGGRANSSGALEVSVWLPQTQGVCPALWGGQLLPPHSQGQL